MMSKAVLLVGRDACANATDDDLTKWLAEWPVDVHRVRKYALHRRTMYALTMFAC